MSIFANDITPATTGVEPAPSGLPSGPGEATPRARVHDIRVTFQRRGMPLHALRVLQSVADPRVAL
jgi:hypothetical protein